MLLLSVLLLIYFVSGAFSTNGFTTPLAMDFATTQLIAMQRENDDMGIGSMNSYLAKLEQNLEKSLKNALGEITMSDCLDDLAYAIMYKISKLCYRISEVDVTHTLN